MNDERFVDLEVKLAYQERLIRELDALVRVFAERLDVVERELAEWKRTAPVGPAAEKPPHY